MSPRSLGSVRCQVSPSGIPWSPRHGATFPLFFTFPVASFRRTDSDYTHAFPGSTRCGKTAWNSLRHIGTVSKQTTRNTTPAASPSARSTSVCLRNSYVFPSPYFSGIHLPPPCSSQVRGWMSNARTCQGLIKTIPGTPRSQKQIHEVENPIYTTLQR